MNPSYIRSFSLGFLAGIVLAGSVALLYAPQEGTKTRLLIKTKATDLRDKAGKFIKKKK
jgi:gas vesicle protein